MTTHVFARLAVPAALLSLAACAPSKAPAPTPAPLPTVTRPAPEPVVGAPSGDWRDWPITKGDWVYRDDARGSIALFGEPQGEARFLVRCDQSRKRIYFSRAGRSNGATKMVIRTSTDMKAYTVGNTGGDPPYLATELQVNDPILDSIAFSRGRFVIEVSGTTPLAIPIYPEFTRVIEDCRK